MQKAIALFLFLVAALTNPLFPAPAHADDYVLQVDNSFHQKVGLYYPVT